jgi:hypothetical protein
MTIEQSRPAATMKGTRLSISSNGRYFVNGDGKPFFYLADTAWTLFKRLTREEADRYFRNRAAKGFSAIQAYVLRGLEVPNLEGHLPLVDRDPSRLNDGFFRNVDYLVDRANELGLVMGLVTCMGEHVAHKDRAERFQRNEQVFTAESAFTYGQLLGARYKDNCVIWFLGGDHEPSAETVVIWDAMGRGLKAGSGGTHLVSYHSSGGHSSSSHFHGHAWLDFNTVQSIHRSADPNYQYVGPDYALEPTKPTLDMEARYENVIDGLWQPRLISNPSGRIDARQAREAAYWAVLAGAAGHGYGHNSIWQLHDDTKVDSAADYSFPHIPATIGWIAAMDSDGAFGMGHMRKLVELRPWYRMVPDQSLIAAGQGEGEDHIQAARAEDGSFVLAYLPFGHTVVMRMDMITGNSVRAQWYDPRRGTFTQIATHPSVDLREFVPPTRGGGNDWVLVLEDESRDYPTEW